MENKNLPIYKVVVNDTDDSGVNYISLVKEPAMEVYKGKSLFVALAEHKKQYRFEANKDKQTVSGPFIIPDVAIYRQDKELGEFYVVFEASEIVKIAKKFNKNKKQTNIDAQHKHEVIDAYVFENWIIEDSKDDKSNKLGFSLPEGTWFGTIQIEDESFWNEQVKTGNVMGFSIDGMLGLSLNKMKEQLKNNKMKNNKVKLAAEAKLKDGRVISTSADAWAEGVDAYWIDADGNQTPCEDGDYELEDGTIVSVAGGKVSAIKPVEVAAEKVEEVKEEKLAMAPEDLAAVTQLVNDAILAYKSEVESVLADITGRLDAIESGKPVDHTEEMSAIKTELAIVKEKFNSLPAKTSMTLKTDLPIKNTKMSVEEQLTRVLEINKKM